MAKEYQVEIYGHPSIYLDKSQSQERKFTTYFNEPDDGINDKTGILLLISGFGGHANSQVYKKMRSEFADKYNLVTVQCDYFGFEYMQIDDPIYFETNQEELKQFFTQDEIAQICPHNQLDIPKLVEIGSKYNVTLEGSAQISETYASLNDMGIMQALDCLTALLTVVAILKDNQYVFNQKKILLYGYSHGAYLAYLCNAFAPRLFSMLVDNSAWLLPVYLTRMRYVTTEYESLKLVSNYDYLARRLPYDRELLELPLLYKNFTNHCDIICYHGIDDTLVKSGDKKEFSKLVDRMNYQEITPDKVDGEAIRSTKHGLNADFLKLFEKVIKNAVFQSDNGEIELPPFKFDTSKYRYYIDYSYGVPVFSKIKPRQLNIVP